jgi:hypothetical protein
MVIEANRSKRGVIENALRRLTAAQARIIGGILVKFDPGKADVGASYLAEYYSYGDDEGDRSTPGGFIPAKGAG